MINENFLLTSSCVSTREKGERERAQGEQVQYPPVIGRVQDSWFPSSLPTFLSIPAGQQPPSYRAPPLHSSRLKSYLLEAPNSPLQPADQPPLLTPDVIPQAPIAADLPIGSTSIIMISIVIIPFLN
ncbi:hypothetical protein KFK09_012328 [Dendrobium nobile]|uniref:Uncharacterized protein n=1 Tax=Dendrobium nobile TaxID=94219 RepID=A0A8T3BF79_DENNO|nr:hypothetical protein KFK09_012328 [Dendrobium nobile]